MENQILDLKSLKQEIKDVSDRLGNVDIDTSHLVTKEEFNVLSNEVMGVRNKLVEVLNKF